MFKKLYGVLILTPILSDPKKGSPHTKGIAIDLTLIDFNGNELDMGTKFDDFHKKCSSSL